MSSNAVKKKTPTMDAGPKPANPFAGKRPANAPMLSPAGLPSAKGGSPPSPMASAKINPQKNGTQTGSFPPGIPQAEGGEATGSTALDESSARQRQILGGLLIIGALALIAYSLLMPTEPTPIQVQKTKQKESERIEQIVNKHLVMTNSSIEIQQKKKNIELKERLHRLGDTVHPRPFQAPPVGVDMSPDRNELNAIHDLRPPSENLNYTSPSTEIMREIADYQRQKAEEEAYNKAYRDAIIAEARRQGFELQIGPNGQILGAKPIKNPTGPRVGQGSAAH